MKKFSVKITIAAFFVLAIFSLSLAQNEHITITTYYPSPYGSYRELTVSNRQAIGDVNGDGKVNVDDLAVEAVSSGVDPEPMNGTLTVARRIGIGTISPAADLHIRRVSTPNSDTGDPRAVISLDVQGGPAGRVASSRWELIASAYENPSSAAPAGNTLMLRKIEGDDIMNSFTQAFIIDEDRHMYIGRSYNADGAWAMPENATLTLGPRSDTDGARLLFTGGASASFHVDNSGGDMRFFTQDFVSSIIEPMKNSTQKFTILNNGNVGIGTASPQGILEVSHDMAAHDLVVNRTTGYVGIGTANPVRQLSVSAPMTYVEDAQILLTDTNGGPAFQHRFIKNANEFFSIGRLDANYHTIASGTDKFWINRYGDVGIGFPPEGRLDVVSRDGTRHDLLVDSNTGYVAIGFDVVSPVSVPMATLDVDGGLSVRHMMDFVSTLDPLYYVLSNNAGLFYQGSLWPDSGGGGLPSSKKYKKDIRDLKVDPAKVFQLRPVEFRWKESGKEDIGLIAEEVDRAIKDLVIYDKEGKPNSVKYDKVPLYLLGALKQQQKEIDDLKAQIKALQAHKKGK